MKKLNLIVLVLFSTMICKAQKDTVKVIMLICDTSLQEMTGWNPDTNQYYLNKYDYSLRWLVAYSVRELHNSSEGVNDAGFCLGCFSDYWKHIQYLDKDKKPLSKNIIVWQSMGIR